MATLPTGSYPGSMIPIAYTELTVSDLPRAKEFYAAAFGWEFTDYGPGYSGIRCGDGEMGGLAAGEPTAGGGPLVLLETADLDATLAAVQAAGGRTEPVLAYPGGRRFVFTDPDGYRLGVFQTQH